MATHIIPILGINTLPDTSGSVYLESFSIKATNDRWPFLVYIFEDTATDLKLYGLFRVPKNYSAGAKAVIEWTSTLTSGDVVWEFDYRTISGNDTPSMDQTGQQISLQTTDTAPSTTLNRLYAEISLTAAHFAADELVEFELSREGSNGSDTMAGSAILFGLFFEYTD